MGERDARERFARAVDSVDGGTDHSGDQDLGAELAVVRDLRRAGTFPVSDQRTRHNVAVRIAGKIAEPAETETAGTAEPTPARRRRLRPVLAAGLCLLAGLGGLALLLSKSALPGDALYPVERAREAAVLALTFDKQEQARQRLAYAADRVDELGMLAERDGAPADSAEAATAALADLESAVRSASVTLTNLAAGTNGEQLRTLRSWAARQSDELAGLAPALSPVAAEQQASSLALLERIEHRAVALHERFDCYRITAGSTDELGAVPATGPCVPPGRGAREQQAPPPAPVPPPATKPTPPGTLAASPVAGQPGASSNPAHRPVSRLAGAQSVTAPRAPLRFEPAPPAPAPPPIDRPRLPSGVGEAPPAADEVVRDLVGDVLDTPLGE